MADIEQALSREAQTHDLRGDVAAAEPGRGVDPEVAEAAPRADVEDRHGDLGQVVVERHVGHGEVGRRFADRGVAVGQLLERLKRGGEGEEVEDPLSPITLNSPRAIT